MAAPAELKPCAEIEMDKNITASISSQPAQEAHIKNIAGTIEAREMFFKKLNF